MHSNHVFVLEKHTDCCIKLPASGFEFSEIKSDGRPGTTTMPDGRRQDRHDAIKDEILGRLGAGSVPTQLAFNAADRSSWRTH